MNKFQAIINTTSYKKVEYFTELSWEKSTMNDYMEAVNGWSTTLDNLQEVVWQIELFNGIPQDESMDDTNYDYIKWINKPENIISFIDKFKNVKRFIYVKAWNTNQGYFDIDKIIEYLRENGSVKIPFDWYPNIKQYNKNPKGCYMEIKEIKNS